MKVLAPPKELPILMSGPMVRAILDGSKTETRRTRGLDEVNAFLRRPKVTELVQDHLNFVENYADFTGFTDGRGYTGFKKIKFPYGGRGTRLWVKEAHKFRTAHSCGESGCECEDVMVVYDADGKDQLVVPEDPEWGFGDAKRPSMFLPKWASRIMLEVVDWDCERVKNIDEGGAVAEGVAGLRLNAGDFGMETHRSAYRRLWDDLNGPGTFDLNPFVWVIKFKRIK